MKIIFGRLASLAFVLNSLLACSNSGSSTPLVTPKTNGQTQSCDFGLNEGDPAQFSLLGIERLSKADFDKEFNAAYLDAIGTANIPNTLKFIQQTGAVVYKSSLIPTKGCSQNLFTEASPMPSDVQSRWDAANGTTESDTYILGLYLPQNKETDAPSLKRNAAIIIRENTNRWTLVHEYMHHLFMVRALQQGYSDAQTNSVFKSSLDEVTQISNRTDISKAEMAALSALPYARLAKALDTKLIHYTLEEMAIEARLQQALSQGRLKYVPKNSNWYIAQSGKSALEIYAAIENMGSTLLSDLSRDGSKRSESDAYTATLRNLSARQSAIKGLQRAYPDDSQQALAGSSLAASASPVHMGCSHEAETEKLLQVIRSLNKVTTILQAK